MTDTSVHLFQNAKMLPGKFFSESLERIDPMGTKIKLQSCFALPEMMTLPEGVETISELLRHIGGMISLNFMDPKSGQLEEDFEVIINGKEVWFYPKKLNTHLKEGDLVELYMVPLGGG